MSRIKGTVKFFNTTKGFGFIKHADSDQETFVHISGISNGQPLAENEDVEFELIPGKKNDLVAGKVERV